MSEEVGKFTQTHGWEIIILRENSSAEDWDG
jgi:hypothetical protein